MGDTASMLERAIVAEITEILNLTQIEKDVSAISESIKGMFLIVKMMQRKLRLWTALYGMFLMMLDIGQMVKCMTIDEYG